MPRLAKRRLLCWFLLLFTGSLTFLGVGVTVHGQVGPTPTPTNTPGAAVTPTPTNTLVAAATPTPTNTPNVPSRYQIAYWGLASGSGRSQGGSYQLNGSAGQAVLGGVASGNGLSLSSGYWGSQPAPLVGTATATFAATPITLPTQTPTATAPPQATPTPPTNRTISLFLPFVTR